MQWLVTTNLAWKRGWIQIRKASIGRRQWSQCFQDWIQKATTVQIIKVYEIIVYVCMYACIYGSSMYVSMYVWWLRVYVCMHLRNIHVLYVCMYVCMYDDCVYMCVCIFVTFMYCMYVCMYVCMMIACICVCNFVTIMCMYVLYVWNVVDWPEVQMQLPLYGVQVLQPFGDVSQSSRYLNLAQRTISCVWYRSGWFKVVYRTTMYMYVC